MTDRPTMLTWKKDLEWWWPKLKYLPGIILKTLWKATKNNRVNEAGSLYYEVEIFLYDIHCM